MMALRCRPSRERFLIALLSSAFVVACGGEELPPYEQAATLVFATPDARSGEYFGTVWPDDRRLDADGFITTEDFPNPNQGPMFGQMLESADRLVKGWGLSAPLYVPFSGPIDPASLPSSAEASLDDDASVFLVAIDDSTYRGQRVPLDWHWMEEPTSFLPGNVLAVRPVVGFPLRPGTRYALVVTTRVRDSDGHALGPDEAFFRGIVGWSDASDHGPQFGPGRPFAQSRAHLTPLADWLDDAGIERTAVAGAAVFTTQKVIDELRALRDFLESRPRPRITNVARIGERTSHFRYHASYDAPYLLHGKLPYDTAGGGFVYDDAGTPVVAKTETMRLSICVPRGEMPEDGWPVVFVSHGTGGDYETQFYDDSCNLLSNQGIVSFGIDQMIHGPRADGAKACLGVGPAEICFLNIVNAVAGRNVLRHSALDHISLRRAVENGIDFGDGTKLDLTRMGFFGHSQGGLTGSMYLAIEPELDGALLSGAGGHLTTTILVRDDGTYRLKEIAESALFLGLTDGEELHQFHPALALVQTMAEATDPASYARYWFREAEGQPKSVFLTSGLLDDMTPYQTTIAMALAAGVPQQEAGRTDSPEFELAGLEPMTGAARGNVTVGEKTVSAALRQFPEGDHFPIFDDPTAREQMARFFRTLVTEEVPEIPAP